MILTISEEAKTYIVNMLERSRRPGVELGLEQQGCTGYKYTWTPVAIKTSDHIVNLDDDHFVVVNNKALPYVIDSEVVIENIGINSRLSIVNPHVAHSCGCGESVNFKNG
jgi:iron-sulfur cluster assembly protein